MTKSTLFLLLITFCSQSAMTQSLSKDNIAEIKLRNAGAIVQNGQVKGYYNFYNLEKQDRKNNNYQLTVTDENLREINSINIVRPNTYLLIEGVFNGEAFGFLFYDVGEKRLEIISYDRTLKETGKINKELKNKYANASYGYIAQGHEPTQAFLVSVPNKGFVYYGIKDDSKSEYEIEFYDNNLKKGWSSYAPKDDFDFENAAEAFQDDQYVGSLILKRTSLFSTDLDFDLLVQTISDGKPLFRIPMVTSKYKLSLAEVFFDKIKNQFTVFGEYFNKDENVIKSASQGFITIVLDLKGKIISEKINSWKTDINKLVAAKDKAVFDDTSLLFHEFIRASDGQTFAIGEQYKKGGPPMAVKLNVYNMVVFQFDANFAITKAHVFEKDKNSVSLPPGMLVSSSKMLSYIAKAFGGFDYVFNQASPDKSTFVITYINYDREKGQKGKNILGSIIYTPEKVFTVDQLPLTRKSSTYFVYRGKEGYVLVSEYFPKEKRIDSRLEKLNY
jgi:hypothetical protein